MRDAADQAQGAIDTLTEAAIRNIRANTQQGLKPTGVCYYCESKVKGQQLFCDIDCSTDYEEEKRLLRLNGRRS